MTGCQKSKKNAHHSWLPIINLYVLKHTFTHSNKLGRHIAEHNSWYVTLYILEKI